MTDLPPVTLAFALLADYSNKQGAAPLSKFENCWEKQIDEQWWIAMNGHDEPRKCSKGAEVEPCNCYVEFNGWPAGILDPFGGILAAGAVANEDSFIEALKAAGAVVEES
jgi:hypothetical protein